MRDTMPEMFRHLLDGPVVDTPYCAVCGRMDLPLNRHHVPFRSQGKVFRDGKEVPRSTITICGSGNASGCHGRAHQHLLHFDVRDGEWWVLETKEACKFQDAVAMDGWEPLEGYPIRRRTRMREAILDAGIDECG